MATDERFVAMSSPFFAVQHEVRAVLGVMRRNTRWSSSARLAKQTLDASDLALLNGLHLVTKDLTPSTDLESTDPLVFVQPFLNIVTAESTSGPITGLALTSLDHFLRANVFSKRGPHSSKLAHSIVDAVTHCRFEATDPEGDEVVLSRILKVLASCVSSDIGQLLSDESVCEIVQSCFRISQQRRMSELLRNNAEEALFSIVRILFRKLRSLAYESNPKISPDIPEITTFSADISNTYEMIDVADDTAQSQTQSESAKQETDGSEVSNTQADHNRIIVDVSPMHTNEPSASDLDNPTQDPADNPNTASDIIVNSLGVRFHQATEASTQLPPYSFPAMAEIFRFICSLISKSQTEHTAELQLLGLRLLFVVFEETGSHLKRFPPLVTIIQESLTKSLIEHCHSENLMILTYSLQNIYTLFIHLRDVLKLHMEYFFTDVFLDALRSKTLSLDRQEVVLESLLQFCQLPFFFAELFVNYDASLTSSNLFEDISKALSKYCIPGKSPLHSGHVLSLQCIVAALNMIGERSIDENSRTRRDEKSSKPAPPEIDAIMKARKRKKDLSVAVDIFNKEPKKGVKALQDMGFLSTPPDPVSLADFLRKTPALTKDAIGQYLGETGDIPLQVLQRYVETFDFHGMAFEAALRLFLESFRLPGEAQKIDRIMEKFSDHYHGQCPGYFASSSTAFVLAFAVIMLNTDHHSIMVKKKMTQEQFLRNVSGINDGADLPRDQLVAIFESITKNEIKLPGKTAGGDSTSLWGELVGRSKFESPYATIVESSGKLNTVYDRELFSMLSQPAIDALSVVYYTAEDPILNLEVTNAIQGLVDVAAKFHLSKVIDNIIIPLCKFTTLQDQYDSQEHVRIIAKSARARNSCILLFKLATMYGDYFQEGWRAIVDCTIKLHRLGLLPQDVAKVDDFIDVSSRKPIAQEVVPEQKSSSIFSTFSQYLLMNPDPNEANIQLDIEARETARESILNCKIETLLNDSRDLQPESLVYFVRAIILASMKPRQIPSTSGDEASIIFCTELLTTIALRNEDRIIFLWILVNEHFTAILTPEALASRVVERTIVCLYRLAIALATNQDILDQLFHCIALIKNMDAEVLSQSSIPEQIASASPLLIQAQPSAVRNSSFFRVLTSVWRKCASNPIAASQLFELFHPILQEEGFINHENYVDCIETLLLLASNKETSPTLAKRSMDLVSSVIPSIPSFVQLQQQTYHPHRRDSFGYLNSIRESASSGASDISLEVFKSFWFPTFNFYGHHASDSRHDVQLAALSQMQRVLQSPETASFTSAFIRLIFVECIFPLIGDLFNSVASPAVKGNASPVLTKVRSQTNEELLIRVLEMLSKSFLHFLPRICTLENFESFWFQILAFMEVFYRKSTTEILREAVGERIKNMLFVMSAQDIFHERNDEIWDNTWRALEAFCPGLKDEIQPMLSPAPSPSTTEAQVPRSPPTESNSNQEYSE
eukprot:TRINITY_DN2845_c0_g1_i8.p1 TRINITY_DN2845_c0_g1~~TRINITY_DN2845_c0_g1_i8.p1  ORF type:complete len:1462 (-),score=322.47 TRINITY_DN2845_c0_g1_i8:108-4493(-)